MECPRKCSETKVLTFDEVRRIIGKILTQTGDDLAELGFPHITCIIHIGSSGTTNTEVKITQNRASLGL